MKKLLLLLFIFLSFISSAYANSIQGAFGYLLGETQSPEVKDCWSNFDCFSYSGFEPKKPLPYYPNYKFNVTFTSNKIYRISAFVYRDSEPFDSCLGSGTDFGKILGMLESKYGDFEGEWGHYVSFFKFEDGDRSVFINCQMGLTGDSYDSMLEYEDFKLNKLHNDEIEAFKKAKFEEESKDYDL